MLAARRLWNVAYRSEQLAALTRAAESAWTPNTAWGRVDTSIAWLPPDDVRWTVPGARVWFASKSKKGAQDANFMSVQETSSSGGIFYKR